MTVAKNYAEALFSLCTPESRDGVIDLLDLVVALLEENHTLQSALLNPTFSVQDRQEVIREVVTQLVSENSTRFGTTIHSVEEVIRLLQIMIENGRTALIPSLAQDFRTLQERALNKVVASVTSAVPLVEEEKASLQSALSQSGSRAVEVHWTVDSSILGGLKVQIGDCVLDGTIQGTLLRMEKSLLRMSSV